MLSALCRGALLAGLGVVLVACAGSGANDGPSFSLPMPKMPELPSVGALAVSQEAPQGSATELYARIARGANSCWFGANGPLKKDYIYNADADAPSRGGKAEITIHARVPAEPNPRGPKAYRIAITPKDESSAKIETENFKMPETAAAAMSADVDRWSRGEQGCKGNTTAAGWDAVAPPAPAAVRAKPAKGTKTGTKAATNTKAAAPGAAAASPSGNQPAAPQ